jgi:hypothetical protein
VQPRMTLSSRVTPDPAAAGFGGVAPLVATRYRRAHAERMEHVGIVAIEPVKDLTWGNRFDATAVEAPSRFELL